MATPQGKVPAMSLNLVIAAELFFGGILAVLALAGWRGVVRRAERRDLASALTGEIVAVLQAIDAESFDPATESFDSADEPAPHLILPHFAIYEANAYRLDRLAPPLALKIPLFFDRLEALARECSAEQATPSHSDAGHTRRLQHMRDDLKSSLDLGDEILLALRPLVSPHSQARHLM
jgi:type II secretory pathway pseudopilin PulG